MERLSVGKLPQISADDVAARIWKHTHTHTHTFNGPLSRTTWVSQYQKGKTNLDFTGSGISWAMCKYAPRSRQITMPAPHHSVFLQAGCPVVYCQKWRWVYAKGRGKGTEGTLLIYDRWGEYTLSKKTPEVGIRCIPAYTPQYTTADALPVAQPTASKHLKIRLKILRKNKQQCQTKPLSPQSL